MRSISPIKLERANVSDGPGGEHLGLGRCLVRVWAVAFATAFLLAWVVSGASAAATTLKVNTTTDETTSGDHLCSLREAIAAANSPGTGSDCGTAGSVSNTIVLGVGTYALSIAPAGADDNASGDLDVTGTTPLTIIGAGATASVIDATGLGDRVLSVGAGATVTLERLTITGGHAPDGAAGANGTSGTYRPGGPGGDGSGGADGGGILNLGSVTLTDVAVTNNSAGEGGSGGAGGSGRVYGGGGGNGGAGGLGGGIYTMGKLTLNDVGMSENSAGQGGAGGQGGGGKLGFYRQIVSGGGGGSGGAGGAGGGIDNAGSAARLTVTASTISGSASGTGGNGGSGGGASGSSGSPGFGGGGGAGGSGGADGGGVANLMGTVGVTGSTVFSNVAGAGGSGGGGGFGSFGGPGSGGPGGLGSSGGGIWSDGGSLSATNSTLYSNGAGGGGEGGAGAPGGAGGAGGAGGDGGAVGVTNGASSLLNVTVDGNQAGSGASGGSSGGSSGLDGLGGGISVQSTTSGDDMVLRNTIVAESSRGANCAGSGSSAITDAGHDLSFPDTTCPGINGDPKLLSFKNFGGPTNTLGLASGSAAIDQVPATGADCPATDQRGVSRPQGSACDIGAFEFAIPQITITSPADGASYTPGSTVLAA